MVAYRAYRALLQTSLREKTVISIDIGAIWLFCDVNDRFVESIYLWKMSHLIIAVISSFSSFAKNDLWFG